LPIKKKVAILISFIPASSDSKMNNFPIVNKIKALDRGVSAQITWLFIQDTVWG